MEMSLTSLKKICRAHGITRWPFRKLMSLERTIDKMNRDSSIIESISAQQVTVPKIGIPGSNESQDQSRSLKMEVNPACKHLLSNIRPIPAIPLSREDSPDPKDHMKHNSGSPDRSMPPPPPRMPPGGSNPEMMLGRETIGGQSGHPSWTGDKGFGHPLLPISFGAGGSSSMQPSSVRVPCMTKPDGAGNSSGGSAGPNAHQNAFIHTATQRSTSMPGDGASPEHQQGDGGPGAPSAGPGGASRPVAEFAADAIPTCNICPHRMQDVLIYNWSNIWSLHNLRCPARFPADSCPILPPLSLCWFSRVICTRSPGPAAGQQIERKREHLPAFSR